MNQEQSIALWRQGKEAWNAWANEMLAKRETLCTSGKWSVKADYKGEISSSNSETTVWLECLWLLSWEPSWFNTRHSRLEPSSTNRAKYCQRRSHLLSSARRP